ncbi:MAG: hypothetical protein AAGA20_17190 [Planctomycetota bacterium]
MKPLAESPPPRPSEGMGLLALVAAVLLGTAWSVTEYLESSVHPTFAAPPAETPLAAQVAYELPIEPEVATGECLPAVPSCDGQTLAPMPSWHAAARRVEASCETSAQAPAVRAGSGVVIRHVQPVSAPADAATSG